MRHTDNFVYNGVGVTSGLLLACCLGLSGCQNDSAHKMAREQHYDYTSAFAKCIPLELHDQTLAEHEHDCARQYYEAKKDEMNTLFAQVSAAYEERVKENPTEMNKAQLDKLMTSQQQFTKLVKKNAKLSNAAFIKDYPYHYYGTMTDYINLRVKHLNNLKKELPNNN